MSQDLRRLGPLRVLALILLTQVLAWGQDRAPAPAQPPGAEASDLPPLPPPGVATSPEAATLPALPRPAAPSPGPSLYGEGTSLLRSPFERTVPGPRPDPAYPMFRAPFDLPIGFSGKSGALPSEPQTTPDFVPIDDRWRTGFPDWDRYGKGHPPLSDYPYQPGSRLNPYNLTRLKGDYPIIGDNIFLDVVYSNFTFMQGAAVPTQTGGFESTARPGEFPFFGHPNQFAFANFSAVQIELFRGDASFKPKDWAVKVTPVYNVNDLSLSEVANTNPNVLSGQQRTQDFFALQEWFGELKLADTSPNYDFISTRVGSQFFTSDFRGFIFSDINRAVRIFGTRDGDRDQFNLLYFRQFEKDTNSGLNSFHDRNQNIFIANYYHQDFIFPGYTIEGSVHYNHDNPTFKIGKNRFLVRPDADGIFQRHTIDSAYLGFAGDGHWGRINVNNAFYWVLGHDSLNPLANRPVMINAQMAAIELSYDRDWMRFRTSFLWFSGDHNINNGHATGFDSILDNQNFAGGIFSYIQRQTIPIFGVNLVQANSLVPDLRASKIQGQSNFVNPGLLLFNLGQDMDLTPKLKMINNMNFLMFDATNVLQQFLFQGNISRTIGIDMSTGLEYRPFLSDNLVFIGGVNVLLPGQGFKDIYSNFGRGVAAPISAFLAMSVSF